MESGVTISLLESFLRLNSRVPLSAEKSLFLAHLVMVASSYDEVKKILLQMDQLVFPIDLSCAQLCSLKNIEWKKAEKQSPEQHSVVERFGGILINNNLMANGYDYSDESVRPASTSHYSSDGNNSPCDSFKSFYLENNESRTDFDREIDPKIESQ